MCYNLKQNKMPMSLSLEAKLCVLYECMITELRNFRFQFRCMGMKLITGNDNELFFLSFSLSYIVFPLFSILIIVTNLFTNY